MPDSPDRVFTRLISHNPIGDIMIGIIHPTAAGLIYLAVKAVVLRGASNELQVLHIVVAVSIGTERIHEQFEERRKMGLHT